MTKLLSICIVPFFLLGIAYLLPNNCKANPVNTQEGIVLDSTVTYQFDNLGDSIRTSRRTFVYNESGLETAEVLETWLSSSNEWGSVTKAETSYNEFDYKTSELYFNWNMDDSEWLGNVRYDYTYEFDTLLSSSTIYTWSVSEGDWLENAQTTYSFNEQGELTGYSSNSWNMAESEWETQQMASYELNEMGEIENSIFTYLDTESQTFVTSSEGILEYANDLLISTVTNVADENGDLIPYLFSEFEHDEMGNRILSAQFQWDATNEVWVPTSKIEFEHDEMGNRTAQINFSWDATAENWIPSYTYEYEYNEDNQQISQVYSTWSVEENVWIPFNVISYVFLEEGSDCYLEAETSYWQTAEEEWNTFEKTHYYYTDLNAIDTTIIDTMAIDTTIIDTMAMDTTIMDTMAMDTTITDTMTALTNIPFANALNIYPNPAIEYCWVDLAWKTVFNSKTSLRLYNLQGELIYDTEVKNMPHRLNLSGIGTGLYLLEVENGELRYQKKLMVK